jgi:NAD(P)-dependent dehydrogenase (short-subunit alcohol dehydrogenase family)
MKKLDGKTALISGATSGIGKVTALAFAREGANVVVAGRREAEGEAVAEQVVSAGGQAIFVQTDVTNEDAVVNVIRKTVETFGELNVLFNNAGGSSNADGPVTSAQLDEFWRVINLDLFGTFLCCRHAIPHMIKSGGGAVINNASMVALKGELNRDCYTAAKGGVIAMTRSMAANFVRDNVRVNAIAPGVVKTERIQAMIEANPAAKKAVAVQPLGLIDPEEIAQLAILLASDNLCSVTGEVFPISGGR